MRVALVTGATGAIGRAIVTGLLSDPTFVVIVLGRNTQRLAQAVAELGRHAEASRVRAELADVSAHDSIRALASRLQGPIDVLVNNAAVAPPRRTETASGIELTFATNVLGYVWMTAALHPFLREGRDPRVVNVASYWAGDLDVEDLEFRRRRYDNDLAYRQSKQANRMLTVAWARRLAADHITVNACHPGDVDSRLSNDLGFGGSESPAAGAAAPIWLATGADVKDVTGGYFERGRRVKCRFADDERGIEHLAQRCDGYP